MDNGWLWGLMTIGGPILFGLVVIWAVLNNRRSPAEIERSERATAQLYEEQDRIDKANEHGDVAPSADTSLPSDSEEVKHAANLSTQHQAPGDATKPRDTLDGDPSILARNWQPGRDEGRAAPAEKR
jgi:hypothetical protein